MSRKWMTAGAAALLLLVTAQAATADTTYNDPAGDAGTAPDITTVAAANDTAGNLTFRVTTNQGALGPDAVIALSFDTDKNANTGSDGVEFLFLLTSQGWALLKWDGTQFVAASASSANASYAPNAATFKVSKTDLGVTDSFWFYVDSVVFDSAGNTTASDTAPDGNSVYLYTLSKPPPPPPVVTLSAGAASFAPAKAVAGHAQTVKVSVKRSDTGGALASGSATCSIKIGSTKVAATGSFKAGVATCAFRIPATAHGKLITGSIRVSGAGASVSKSFSKRVS